MAAEGGGARAAGLGGYFNQLLVKSEAAAECVTALTRVSGGPSAFLFCVTGGDGQGGPRSAAPDSRGRRSGFRWVALTPTCLSWLMKFVGEAKKGGRMKEMNKTC